MALDGKRILVCNCEGTMPIDADALAKALSIPSPHVHSQLCRAQIESFSTALNGDSPVMVCCTQEEPMFEDVRDESGRDTDVSYVNIRERAGWSEDAAKAAPKMAALIAEAAEDLTPAPAVTLTSDGRTLVYGDGQATLDAARQLSDRLDVTCLLRKADDALPPSVMNVPLFTGTITQASGSLGNFQVSVNGQAAAEPSARGSLNFDAPRDDQTAHYDLIVDLSGGTALFPAPEKREGYVRADPAHAGQVARALFDAADLVGEFEKPRYIKVDTSICAHGRSGKVGCSKCLEACPTSAIRPSGDAMTVDERICAGHGSCAAVCPTGALHFDLPSGGGLFNRLRTLLKTFLKSGGAKPVVLIHDGARGAEVLDMSARLGRGLPASVLPFAVSEVTQVGLDMILAALAYGASQVRVLTGPEHRDSLDTLNEAAGLANTIAAGLGYTGVRAVIDDGADPASLEDALYGAVTKAPPAADPAGFSAQGNKRQTFSLALTHLHAVAPAPVDDLPLQAGAPFGRIIVDAEKCTLCLSCVGACPAKAIGDNPDRPQLSFTESKCVQCGLCRSTCPENAITLETRLTFGEANRTKKILHEEAPFCCTRCGKPFANKSAIEHMMSKLADHPMFGAPGKLDLLKMCDDCRVAAQFEDQSQGAPMAGPTRPTVRTTEDYLKGDIDD